MPHELQTVHYPDGYRVEIIEQPAAEQTQS
jgi:hypothetical protein